MKKYHILLVEDAEEILEYNNRELTKAGYLVSGAKTIREAKEVLASSVVDLIVLDILLPDGSGADFCREIRPNIPAPILFLTSMSENRQIVQGLNDGGDDYIVKPYRIEELIARIKSHLRSAERRDVQVLTSGEERLEVDRRTLRAYLNGKDLMLKPKEFQILSVLLQNMHRYIQPEELYNMVWGMDFNEDVRTVMVHISKLRMKLKCEEEDPLVRIEKSKDNGYRLVMRF